MATSLALAVAWSLSACVTFGIQNFILAYTGGLPHESFATNIGLVWASSGAVGAVSLLSHHLQRRRVNGNHVGEVVALSEKLMAVEGSQPQASISFVAVVVAAAGGVTASLAQVFLTLAFAADPSAAGPLTAIVCGDIVVVSAYCHCVYGERLNHWQWLAVFGIVLGLVIISCDSAKRSPGENIVAGVIWAICGMMSFSLGVITIRACFERNLDAALGFCIRMITTGLLGLVLLLFACAEGTLQRSLLPVGFANSKLWLLPSACGALQAMGVSAINRALANPHTGICVAIFGSNSVMVLLLAALIEQTLPTPRKLAGMVIVVGSCALISLAAGPLGDQGEEALDDEETLVERMLSSPVICHSFYSETELPVVRHSSSSASTGERASLRASQASSL